MKLSIVIVNFNGTKYLRQCLESIEKFVLFPHEVIIVDNASTDGSAEFVKENFPGARLILSEKNLGFASGNNLGARSARGKYLLLLNQDTQLRTDLSSAIELLEQDQSIGVVGARMIGIHGEHRHSSGFFPSSLRLVKLAWLYQRDEIFAKGEEDTPARNRSHRVDWVEGSFLLTRQRLWENMGGLDESYFMYLEDVDYCRRVINTGMSVVYFPAVSYVHEGGYGENRFGMLVKGFRRYHAKHSGRGERFLANLILNVGLLVRAAVFMAFGLAGYRSGKTKASNCWKTFKENPW